jgi:hypothetical protein
MPNHASAQRRRDAAPWCRTRARWGRADADHRKSTCGGGHRQRRRRRCRAPDRSSEDRGYRAADEGWGEVHPCSPGTGGECRPAGGRGRVSPRRICRECARAPTFFAAQSNQKTTLSVTRLRRAPVIAHSGGFTQTRAQTRTSFPRLVESQALPGPRRRGCCERQVAPSVCACGTWRWPGQGRALFERSEFARTPGYSRLTQVAPPHSGGVADSRVAFSLLTFFWRSKRK